MFPFTAISVAPLVEIRRSKAARRLARWAAFLCVLVAVSVLSASCGRIQQPTTTPQDGYTMTMVVQPSQPDAGDGTLVVTLHDATGNPVTGAGLQVEGNMKSRRDKPSFGKVTGEDAGQYIVAIQWTMAATGMWTSRPRSPTAA